MWIQHQLVADPDSPVGTTALINQHTDGERVAFSPNSGKANVRRAIGEALVDAHDHIVSLEDGADADRDAATDTTDEE